MRTRVLTVAVLVVTSGTASAQTPAGLGAILTSHYGSLYGLSPGENAGVWNSHHIAHDTIWYELGQTTNADVRVSYSSLNVVLGTVDLTGGNFTAIASVNGSPTGVVDQVLQFRPASGNRFQFTTGGTSAPFSWIPSSDPFAFALLTPSSSGYSVPTGLMTDAQWDTYWSGQIGLGSLTQSDSLYGGPANFLAYRLPDTTSSGGTTHYALVWQSGSDYIVFDVTGVRNPEPTSFALLGLGAAGLVGYRLRRKGRTAEVAPN